MAAFVWPKSWFSIFRCNVSSEPTSTNKNYQRNAAITSAIIPVSFIHNSNIRISNCFEITHLFYASLTPWIGSLWQDCSNASKILSKQVFFCSLVMSVLKAQQGTKNYTLDQSPAATIIDVIKVTQFCSLS